MKKVLLFIVISLLLAGIGYFLWKQFLAETSPVVTPPEEKPIEKVTKKPAAQARTITDKEIASWPDPGFTRNTDGGILTDEENFLKVLPTQN